MDLKQYFNLNLSSRVKVIERSIDGHSGLYCRSNPPAGTADYKSRNCRNSCLNSNSRMFASLSDLSEWGDVDFPDQNIR